MDVSRRDVAMLLPAFAVSASAQEKPVLPTKLFVFDALPVRQDGHNVFRAILDGVTRAGYHIELHETELAAGEAPHPPHQHANEELLMIREGTVEVTIGDKATRLGAGAVAYIASNQLHGWRNVGTTPAKYFVLALGLA
jgi:quercetin dioxygenase-like cupin family protein